MPQISDLNVIYTRGPRGPQGPPGPRGIPGSADRQLVLGMTCSDEVTPITVGTDKFSFSLPVSGIIRSIYASCIVAPSGNDIVIGINKNGSSILSTNLYINEGSRNTIASIPTYVMSDTSIDAGDVITIDFNEIGTGVSGIGVKVWFIIDYFSFDLDE